MSAADDLRDLEDQLDGVMHGALWPHSLKCSTVRGRKCQALAEELRTKLYHAWMELNSMKMRLLLALEEVEGQRHTNAVLTDTLLRTEQLLRNGKVPRA